MCGIAGLLDTHKSGHPALMQVALDQIKHRGPDGSGACQLAVGFGSLTLGHNRLAIQDLDDRALQPMKRSHLTVVFNGEIYNFIELRAELQSLGFKFSTTSDTEVLIRSLEAWGLKALEKFDGMFAFCLVDTALSKAWLVRDPFGIKPLYFGNAGERFAFASEPLSVLTLLGEKPVVDERAALEFILDGSYDQHEGTFFENVRQILPGSLAELDLQSGNVSHRQWFKLPETLDKRANLELELKQSITRQLRSDVPYAVALSGGIDSTIVSAIASESLENQTLETFGYVSEDQSVSEEKWQKIASAAIGTNHTVVRLPHAELIDQIREQIRTIGEPFGGTSLFAQRAVFRSIRSSGVTVSLDGQGADELFAGYDGYNSSKFLEAVRLRELGQAKRIIRSVTGGMAGLSRFLGICITELFGLTSPATRIQRLARFALVNRWGSGVAKPALGLRVLFANRRRLGVQEIIGEANGFLERKLAEETWIRSLPALLKHADRNSMRSSLESRVPYLSAGVASAAFSLLKEKGALGFGRKVQLINELNKFLPPAIAERSDKIGFSVGRSGNQRVGEDVWRTYLVELSQLSWVAEKVLDLSLEQAARRFGTSMCFRMLVMGVWLESLREDFRISPQESCA